MANKTQAQMSTKVLRRLGVLGGDQTASAPDSVLVNETIDSVHTQYQKRGLAPFAISAWPDWAQEPYAKIISAEVAPYFGIHVIGGQTLEAVKMTGEKQVYEQMQGKKHRRPIESKFF